MRLITYTDPRKLHRHPNWDLISHVPHICATESLTKGLQDYYGPTSPDGLPRVTAVSVNLLLSKLLPDWLSERTRVVQFALLRKILRELEQTEQEHGQLIRAFRHNLSEVLNGIRLLEECGLSTRDLKARTPEERLFLRVWQEMRRQDKAITSLQQSLFKTLRQPPVMRRQLIQALMHAAWVLQDDQPAAQALHRACEVLARDRKLILHGFYFITPLQQQFFNLLQNAGFELIGLACWDARREQLFRAWASFYPGQQGSRDGPEPEPAGRVFSAVVTGAVNPPNAPHHLRIVRYPDLGAFLAHIRQDQLRPEFEREQLCSPLSDELNEILKEYYPERYPDRHFLSYPVGKFIVQLVNMWDESAPPESPRKERLRITPDALFDCFASGLLRLPGPFGKSVERRQLTGSLQKLLPFFDGCETRKDWMRRCQELRLTHRAAARFDAYENPQTARQRTRQLLANPLRRISYLNVSRKEVDHVIALIKRLFAIAERLHSEHETTLSNYLKKLATILADGGADRALLPEERKLFDAMLNTLRTAPADDRELFPTEDLGHALAYYLGVVARESNSKMVAALAEADGLPLRNRERPIHLCLLGEGALPRQTRVFPWPLTRFSFRDPNHWAVKLLRKREDTSVDASLYLFYSALAFSRQVTLSWVAEWQGEPVQESLYLLMLQTAGVRLVHAPYGLWKSSKEPVLHTKLVPETAQEVNLDDIAPHAAAEFEVCPLRFCYSHIASDGPVYSSAFHLGFVYSGILTWYRCFEPISVPEAANEINKFFPQFTQVRKQDIMERYGYFNRYWMSDEYDGHEYPLGLRRVFLLGLSGEERYKRVISQEARYKEVLDRIREAVSRDNIVPTPGYHCRYCPHNNYCAEAVFPIDEQTTRTEASSNGQNAQEITVRQPIPYAKSLQRRSPGEE